MSTHKEALERTNQSYKMNFRGKKVYRTCLGVHCRSVKMFWSYGGARLCQKCAEAIEGISNIN